MAAAIVTVEQAAAHLHLHPKTVLRYIHDGRLPATRLGKSYRIARAQLNAFAGVASDQSEVDVRTTCIVEIPNVLVDVAERLATFLQSIAIGRPGDTPPLHLQTAFDPIAKSMKVVVISSPSNVADMLQLLQAQLSNRL